MTPVVIEDLLRSLGIQGQRRGTKWHARCPSPDHPDRSPSWFIRDDPGARWHGAHRCRSCELAGGPWELVAAVRRCTLQEAAAHVRALSGGPPVPVEGIPSVKVRLPRRPRYTLPPGVVIPASLDDWYEPALEYLLARGITPEQLDRWRVGYAKEGPLAWRVVVPIVTRGKLAAYVARSIFDDGSKRYDMPSRQTHGRETGARPDVALWGESRFDPDRGAVTVAEGVFSGMALERAGAPNPCALLGSQLTPLKLSLLMKWPVVLVATDPDAAGDRVADELRRALRRHSYVERVQLDRSPDDYDSSELHRLRHALLCASGGFANVHVA